MDNYLKRILIGIIFIFMLGGCIKIEQVYKINQDGTGVVEQSLGVDKVFIAMLKSITPPGEKSISIEEQLKNEAKQNANKLGEGVGFKEIKNETKGDTIYYTTIYTFTDITKVKGYFNVSALFIEGKKVDIKYEKSQETGDNKDKNTAINYLFNFSSFKRLENGTSELVVKNTCMGNPRKIEESQKEIKETQDNKKDAIEDMSFFIAKQLFKDLSICISMVCEGDILETNASNVEGNRIIFLKMDFGRLLEDKIKFKELEKKYPNLAKLDENVIAFINAIKEVFGKTEGFKAEFKNEIKVEYMKR